MRKLLSIILLSVVVFSPVRADEVDDAIADAVAYLKAQGDDATAAMALVAAGEAVDVSFLKSFSGDSAIAYAKPIMALTAAGEDARAFPDEDFVVKMKGFADDTQLGNASQVNDDIWGILALLSAGVSADDSVVQNSKSFILSNQNTDGGWAWNVGGTSDTNDTAVAIMALLEVGMTGSDSMIQNAVTYLKGAQNDDGGFPYDPESTFSTDSDANSDAWVIMAFNKLGEDIADVVVHLLSLQDEDGGFWWMAPPADFNNKAPTADAVIALTGNSFPVTANSSPSDGGSGAPEAFYRIVGSTEEICRGAVPAGNALDVVINAADECGYTYEIQEFSFGLFLSRIGEDAAEGTKGWLYTVDEELPSIGAGDFELSGGENVLWYYADFDDEPPTLGDVSDSVDLTVEVTADDGSDGGGGGDGGTPEVGFSVDPSSLDFGQLVPGSSVSDQLTLKNEGQKNLNIEIEVKGDSIFNFLQLNDILWNLFSMILPVGGEEEVGVSLSIPTEFSSFGEKQGSLIFWGTAAD